MNNSNVFVVIVTFNAMDWIDFSVGRLRDSLTALQTIVVDNCSSDSTSEVVEQKYPGVELINLEKNIGFGRANNIGIKKAYDRGADYILLLNQDAWLENNTIDLLINTHKKAGYYGIVSPMHLDRGGGYLDYNFRKYIAGNNKLVSDLALREKHELDDVYSVDFVNAAIWLLPRKTIEIVGGFNPIFFMYGEDREYVNRCKYHQLEIGIVPHAHAYHGRVQADSEKKTSKLQRIKNLTIVLDPNKQYSVAWQLQKIVASALAAIIMLDFKRLHCLFLDLEYFLRNRRIIAESKEKNKSSKFLYL